jgi:hypothetical protein
VRVGLERKPHVKTARTILWVLPTRGGGASALCPSCSASPFRWEREAGSIRTKIRNQSEARGRCVWGLGPYQVKGMSRSVTVPGVGVQWQGRAGEAERESHIPRDGG